MPTPNTEFTELYYGRKLMQPNVVNMSIGRVIDKLRERVSPGKSEPVYIHLEPGDGTKYELVLMYNHGALLVTRIGGLGLTSCFYQSWGHEGEEWLKQQKNEWSMILLKWFLDNLEQKVTLK